MQDSIYITRRRMMAATFGTLAGTKAWATSGSEPIVENFDAGNAQVKVRRYRKVGSDKRPTVLLLHGSKGLDAQFPAYEGYARGLAQTGIDTLLFTYFRPDDLTAINEATTASGRETRYARAVERWVSLVRGIGEAARADSTSSGHVGILGFSLGGLVGVAAASRPLFSVLVVFYAGIPSFYEHEIAFLPPVLDIHGSEDRAIPLRQGSRLIATAKHLGGVADIAVFQNQGHGFDLDLSNPDAARARRLATTFISEHIER